MRYSVVRGEQLIVSCSTNIILMDACDHSTEIRRHTKLAETNKVPGRHNEKYCL